MLHLVLTIALQAPAAGPSPQELWRAWSEARYITTPAPCLQV